MPRSLPSRRLVVRSLAATSAVRAIPWALAWAGDEQAALKPLVGSVRIECVVNYDGPLLETIPKAVTARPGKR